MHGEDRLNIKTQLIIGALKLAEFPDHISIDYVITKEVKRHIIRSSTCDTEGDLYELDFEEKSSKNIISGFS